MEIDIYGPQEDKIYWLKCETLINNSHHSIFYNGVIQPHLISNVISNYHLFVLPTLNENFGHIILETINSSVPVLISDQTPWLELEEIKAGKEISLENMDLWVQWIIRFYNMDETEYQEWRTGAWKLAKGKLEQTNLLNKYKMMFN